MVQWGKDFISLDHAKFDHELLQLFLIMSAVIFCGYLLAAIKCYVAFVAQLSTTKKLQREGGLQTTYSTRYFISSPGFICLMDPISWLCVTSIWLCFCIFFHSGILKNENGVPEDEENFDEAIKNVNTALNPTKVPDPIYYTLLPLILYHMYDPSPFTLFPILYTRWTVSQSRCQFSN